MFTGSNSAAGRIGSNAIGYAASESDGQQEGHHSGETVTGIPPGAAPDRLNTITAEIDLATD